MPALQVVHLHSSPWDRTLGSYEAQVARVGSAEDSPKIRWGRDRLVFRRQTEMLILVHQVTETLQQYLISVVSFVHLCSPEKLQAIEPVETPKAFEKSRGQHTFNLRLLSETWHHCWLLVPFQLARSTKTCGGTTNLTFWNPRIQWKSCCVQ